MYVNQIALLNHRLVFFLFIIRNRAHFFSFFHLMKTFFFILCYVFNNITFSCDRIQERSLRSVQQKEATSTEEEEPLKDNEKPKKEPSILSRVKRKRRQKNKCSWETKKLNCADCGRWFPSAALLNAHSLQHGTKKSGKYED